MGKSFGGSIILGALMGLGMDRIGNTSYLDLFGVWEA